MGAANGTVLRLTKIYDSGLPEHKWNLVIVAEGYTAAEQAQFQQDAQDFVDRLFTNAPFDEDEVACAINIYRLDVESDESGANNPVCDGTGSGSTPDTYFDATFCSDGVIHRLLSGDEDLVKSTVGSYLPNRHSILVIVNSSIFGGSGPTGVAWTTTNGGGSDWRDVAIHEMGHSLWGLKDEYDCYTCKAGETGRDNYPHPEPMAANITIEPDPALVKWNAFVTAGPDVPTHDNPDCSQRNTGPSPVAPGIVGTFEGAHFYHCDVYRPQYRCKMRSVSDQFCVVCQDVIRQFFATYAAPSTSGAVVLDTDPVTFNDIPVDLAVRRAAAFSVDSCVPVTFQVTTLPSAPFSLVSPSTLVVYPSGPSPWKAYIWFQYSCDLPNTNHNDSVTIDCLETGETFSVALSGNCKARSKVAVQLVFDKSLSMLDMTDEGRTKEQVLRDSARALTEVLYDDNGVGLNAYDEDPHPILNVQVAGAPGSGLGRDDVDDEITNFNANPLGLTAIGDGIELARDRLNIAAGFDTKAMIVLTDGVETADKRINDVAGSIVNQYVYAIGLGTGSQIHPDKLTALTNDSGGYLLMSGNLSADDTFLLAKYYLQILMAVTNNDIILDPEGFVHPGKAARIPFNVTRSDIEITGVVLSRAPYVMEIALETPEGQIIGPGAGSVAVAFRRGSQTVNVRASLPQLVSGQAAHEGRWHLLIYTEKQGYSRYRNIEAEANPAIYREVIAHGLKYSANVYTYSNLRLDGRVLQNSFEPGALLTIRASLSEFGVPFKGNATVRVELDKGDGSSSTLALSERGAGEYSASTTADHPGIYKYRIIANGRTVREEPFTRELIVTAPVWQGGDTPLPDGDDRPGQREELCELLRCWLEQGAINDEGRKRLEEWGIDIEVLLKCLCF